MIINLTGQAGAGKTTIAKELKKILHNSIIIDGDELREIFINKDYSEEGRRKNITNAYNIARFLEAKGFTPIIALISPYEDLREELKSITGVKEIYIHTTQIRGRENYFAQNYSSPKSNFLDLSTDGDLSSCIEKIIKYYLND
jgi:adenylylsulfate kinase